ncbi:MAG: tRNA (adenosine(37)-N6)-threonylcarbamoyltransferase complex transferase subunit TsaD [Ignavibacteriae bacterium]|nr:tRNA (adenosine(37)-N6)-threonylcarbamoyltransferase complex transferase subunit TsaD [Ignavibacteriota bacterium]
MEKDKLYILAFESSCDETSVAVLQDDKVISNVILSQEYHTAFGGVVPEIASREHLRKIVEMTDASLKKANIEMKDIDLVAATSEPGLIGAILIGLSFAKSLAATLNKPFIPVNHIQAHLYSAFINDTQPEFPFIALIVSGGHTLLILVEDFFKHKILGTTIDDAVGEAFDKVAKMMGLGYPGGPLIDKYAKDGDINFHEFPISVIKNSKYNFSFSGIKTSVLYYLRDSNFQANRNDKLISDISASFQHAAIKTLYSKVRKAAKEFKVKDIAISGGVSANSYLNQMFKTLEKDRYRIHIPELIYTTDNAAMIGITAYYKYLASKDKDYFSKESLSVKARPRLDFTNF